MKSIMPQSIYDKFQNISLEKKQKEITHLKLKYPSRIPVIAFSKPNQPQLSKSKYLVENTMTIGQFLTTLRKYMLNLNKSEAIFLFTEKNTLIPNSWTLAEVYNSHKNIDGFLYIEYSLENTFG